MKALVTGFEPFGGEAMNASLEAVRRLPARVGALEIETATLPTSFARAHAALEAAIMRTNPDIVLCVGQAGDRAALCIERVAINVQDAEIADKGTGAHRELGRQFLRVQGGDDGARRQRGEIGRRAARDYGSINRLRPVVVCDLRVLHVDRNAFDA